MTFPLGLDLAGLIAMAVGAYSFAAAWSTRSARAEPNLDALAALSSAVALFAAFYIYSTIIDPGRFAGTGKPLWAYALAGAFFAAGLGVTLGRGLRGDIGAWKKSAWVLPVAVGLGLLGVTAL